jgi:hypothetical protein
MLNVLNSLCGLLQPVKLSFMFLSLIFQFLVYASDVTKVQNNYLWTHYHRMACSTCESAW